MPPQSIDSGQCDVTPQSIHLHHNKFDSMDAAVAAEIQSSFSDRHRSVYTAVAREALQLDGMYDT